MPKITKPVSLAAVAALVAPGQTSLGRICTAEGINKWAKFKPYHAATLGELTDTQRRGAGSLPGVYYGVKMSPGTSQIFGIHYCTYDLAPESRPQGGEASPYRLQDFSGYNHSARPDFYGSAGKGTEQGIPVASTRALEIGITVRDGIVDTLPGDDEVQIMPIVSAGGTTALTLTRYFPMVCISERPGSTHYVRAMCSNRTGEPRRLEVDGERETTYYTAVDDCPALSGITDKKTVSVSYFLSSHLQASVIDFSQWQPIAEGTLLPGGYQAWGIPGCCGLRVTFAPAHVRYIESIRASASKDGITVFAPLLFKYFTDHPLETSATYQVEVQTLNSAGEIVATFRINITAYRVKDEEGNDIVLTTGNQREWPGLVFMPGQTTELTVNLTAFNPDGSTAVNGQQTFSIKG